MSEAHYPPAEQPADGDWSGQTSPQRYSASASVPVPPAATPPGPPPVPPSGGTSLGQPPTGSHPATGQARVSATASVPVPPAPPAAPQTYGAPPQGYSAQPGVYGQPTGGMGQPPVGGAQFGQPGPPGQFGQPSGGPGQFPPPQAFNASPPPPGYPAPAPTTYGTPTQDRGPGPMGQGGYPPATYGQPAPDAGRQRDSQGPPTDGWPYVENAPPAPKKRKGLIIALIAVAILLVVGVGGYVGWSLTKRGASFAVGDCVKQDGSNAVASACSESGAYRITSIVETENTCPDARQPSLVLTEPSGAKKYACLAPAS